MPDQLNDVLPPPLPTPEEVNGQQPVAATNPTCPHCGEGPFKNERGLKAHIGISHPEHSVRQDGLPPGGKKTGKRTVRRPPKTGTCPVPGCGRTMIAGRIPNHLRAMHPDYRTPVADRDQVHHAAAEPTIARCTINFCPACGQDLRFFNAAADMEVRVQ